MYKQEPIDEILRVITLYRVSIRGQVYKTGEEIPMQKEACHKFINGKSNWVLVDELYEKGVSGSKVSAKKRDAIQILKDRAIKKEFDVLLVWKFDRLGRIESETPMVLQWFVKEGGIQVWSVQEGQRKLETSADTLINYITFWQADTESKNTAMRIKERMGQLKEQGLYTGGPVPLGFIAVNKGRVNKKGQPIPDLILDDEFSEIVRENIFYAAHDKGYGAYIIGRELKQKGITGAEGKPISVSSIKRILRNKKYRGTIVEDAIFDKVQVILDQRASAKSEARHYNMQARAKALLSGNIFCGHCGHRLSSNLDRQCKDADPRIRYICYHKTQKRNNCEGQSTYQADIIDELVEKAVLKLFSKVQDRPKESAIKMRYELKVKNLKEKKAEAEKSLEKSNVSLAKLQSEIVKCLSGDSVFDSDDLGRMIHQQKDIIKNDEEKLELIDKELENKTLSMESIIPAYDRFKSWIEEYTYLPLEQKRMVLCELISRIEISRGYEIKIMFNIEYNQFCEMQEDDLPLRQL